MHKMLKGAGETSRRKTAKQALWQGEKEEGMKDLEMPEGIAEAGGPSGVSY